MSQVLLFFIFIICSEWTPSHCVCTNGTGTSAIVCHGFSCPGRRSYCSLDSDSQTYTCSGCSSPNRDPCTCLTSYRGCNIEQNATNAIGRPTVGGVPQTTYSCVNSSASTDCHYEVHVLGTISSNGDVINWARVLGAGTINVDISVTNDGNSSKGLVFALLSHYPANWVLNVPSGVVIEKVLLSSYHLDVSDVSYPPGSVKSVEKLSNMLLPSLANGFDEYGDHTLQALTYLTEKFGSVTSFTGTFNADRFTVAINRRPPLPECSSMSRPPVSMVPSPVLSAQCHPLQSDSGSCFGIGAGATCSGDGYCRCPNDQNRDECTCLVKYGSCQVAKAIDGANSAGVPSYRGRPQITYSCAANDNCQNSVHVISTYEARSVGLFSVRAGSVRVSMSVTGEDTKPLILVLTSYNPIQWSLSIPQGVTVDRIIVSSYFRYLSQTSVSGAGSAVVEKINCSRTVQCYADGYDGDTLGQLQYISRRFGPVATWSSAYRTDSWRLHIQRQSGCTPSSGSSNSGGSRSCPSVVPIPTTTSTTTATTNPLFPDSPFDLPFGTSQSFEPSAGVTSYSYALIIGVTLALLIVIVVPIAVIVTVVVICLVCIKKKPVARPSVSSVGGTHLVAHPAPPAYVSLGGHSVPGHSAPDSVLKNPAPPSYLAAMAFPPQPATTTTTASTAIDDVSEKKSEEKLESPPPYYYQPSPPSAETDP